MYSENFMPIHHGFLADVRATEGSRADLKIFQETEKLTVGALGSANEDPSAI
jgi:hypothetical protein